MGHTYGRCGCRPEETQGGGSRPQPRSPVTVVGRCIEDLGRNGVHAPPISSRTRGQPTVDLIRHSQEQLHIVPHLLRSM